MAISSSKSDRLGAALGSHEPEKSAYRHCTQENEQNGGGEGGPVDVTWRHSRTRLSLATISGDQGFGKGNGQSRLTCLHRDRRHRHPPARSASACRDGHGTSTHRRPTAGARDVYAPTPEYVNLRRAADGGSDRASISSGAAVARPPPVHMASVSFDSA